MEEEMTFDDFRQKALDSGCTNIQLDGGHPVNMATWRGVSNSAAGGPGDVNMVNVRYYLEGKRLRVRKDFNGEFWYTLR